MRVDRAIHDFPGEPHQTGCLAPVRHAETEFSGVENERRVRFEKRVKHKLRAKAATSACDLVVGELAPECRRQLPPDLIP